MSDILSTIRNRFDAIKDHKPKASKKLNDLGSILADAYLIDPDIADGMWQYLVNLNVIDNPQNAKFYIAQVFNKIIDRLKPEEATELITMTPERVYLMVLYGYEGGTLWRCLDVLLKGYIKLDAADNAAICIEYFYEKFGGINSNHYWIMRVVQKAAKICANMIKAKESEDAAKEFLCIIGESENKDVNGYIDIIKAISGISDLEDYDELFEVAKVKKYPVEFYDLLWAARDHYNLKELQKKWIEYVNNCEKDDIRPYNYMYDDGNEYRSSKLKFYVDMEKDADELLSYYFNRPNIYDVEKGVMWIWIEEGNWDSFTKYVALTVMATSEASFVWSSIKRILDEFMVCAFKDCSFERKDRFGRSYNKLMESRCKEFAKALARISAITIGCDSHESYHEFIKDFVQRLNGNLNVINDFGFEEKIETRSAEERLKDYTKEFLGTGELVHGQSSTMYSLIMDAIRHEIEYDREEKINLQYRFAMDDDIAKFYFQHCPEEYQKRQEMLTACIRKNNVDRAIELVDMMEETKGNPEYEELNGWGRQNMLTLKYLIDVFDYTKTDRWETEDITDDMRQVAKQLVYRMLPHLSIKAGEEIKKDLYKINPDNDDSEEYIAQLLEDADIYTTFPKPKGKGSTININRMSDEFIHCFKRLSWMKRLDIVAQIMSKFASVKDILKPVTFKSWINILASNLTGRDLITVFKSNPEIFEAWLDIINVSESEILSVASKIRWSCTRSEYTSFRNMIVTHRGMVDGLDDAFRNISENTETKMFDGCDDDNT